MDAIDARDWQELAGELGDLLLQAVFFSQMAAEENLFRIDDALDAINSKLIRRHPHVFGDQTAQTEGDVRKIWSEVKAEERKDKPRSRSDPARTSCRAACRRWWRRSRSPRARRRSGFDWENAGAGAGEAA